MLQIPTKDKLNIHIIGAGGTGAYLAETLGRLLSNADHSIHIHDGDQVEFKNLKRQNFTESELDLNKAEALVERLSDNITDPPELVAHPNYITDRDEFLIDLVSTYDADNESLIVISALDNVASRQLLNQVVMEDLKESGIATIMLDSGNDDQGGQVALYTNAPIYYKSLIEGESLGVLPTMLEIFPELTEVEDENPGLALACEDNVESYPQAMMANVRNADILADVVYQLYESNTIAYNLWQSDIATATTSAKFTGFRKE